MAGVRRKRHLTSKSPSTKISKKKLSSIDFALDVGDGDSRDYTRNRKNGDDDIIESSDDSGDESVLGSSNGGDGDGDGGASVSSSDGEDRETVEEKQIRLAREYLTKMEQAGSSSSDDDSDGDDDVTTSSDGIDSDDEAEEKDRLGRRLERERLKSQGTLERMLAQKVQVSLEQKWKQLQMDASIDDPQAQAKKWVQHQKYKLCRGHDLTPTCVALHTPSGSRAYSASKDNSIIMWDVDSQRRMHTIVPKWNPKDCEYTRNSGEVLAMAASDDGRYLAVGGRDATVKIYDVRQKKSATNIDAKGENFAIRGIATTFEGHKGPVTALAFRSKSLQLFSGSNDRCIRHYNLQELTYIETLYGHQAPVSGISCYGIRNEIPFSVGRDRTARAWKLAEETHLIFRGGAKLTSADCISSMKDDWFLTGHDNGSLNLWMITKKRAAGSIQNAHGFYGSSNSTTNSTGVPRGIATCASLGGSDLAITGSNDGYMRLWNVSDHFYHLFFLQEMLTTF